MNLLTLGIALSVLASVFYYWATAKGKWLKAAYVTAVLNGLLLIWVNWVLAGRGRVPELSLSEIEWTSNTHATNLFTILCVWMIIAGCRGLIRLKRERRCSSDG